MAKKQASRQQGTKAPRTRSATGVSLVKKKVVKKATKKAATKGTKQASSTKSALAPSPRKKTSTKQSVAGKQAPHRVAASKRVESDTTVPQSGGTTIPPANAPAHIANPSVMRSFAIDIARLCAGDHCAQVLVYDVGATSHLADYLVLASGTSDRQMKSVLRHIEELGRNRNIRPIRSDADQRATWMVLDFALVVVHLFEPSTRAHYDLEMLWGDAPQVDWESGMPASPMSPAAAPSRDHARLMD